MNRKSLIYSKLNYIFDIILSKMRIIHFRLLGIQIGDHCAIGRGVTLQGNIEIGDNTVIGAYTRISTHAHGKVVIGKDCLINSLSVIGSSEQVIIDDHCIFAAYVQIIDASHGINEQGVYIKHAPFHTAPVYIGKNVWLGSGVVVAKGVSIGEGAVIGAKSFVNKSIPSWSIAFGIPAKVNTIRFKEKT